MKAFISYSLNEREQYIATLLSYRLREQGFTLIMSNNIYDYIDITTRNQIFVSQLFVGLISNQSAQWNRVLQEYDLAIQNNTPAILLIEEGVPVANNFAGDYVVFNRANLHYAIEEIKNRMLPNHTRTNNESIGWVLGGAAVLGIIALLANNSKK